MENLIGFLIFLLIYIALVCIPYVKQGGVTEKTEESFQASDFYQESKGPDRAAILFQNTEALEERIRLIAGASEKIVLSTFDFHADNSGKKVLAALYDAARRGVEVEILVDGISYFLQARCNEYFMALGTLENVIIPSIF